MNHLLRLALLAIVAGAPALMAAPRLGLSTVAVGPVYVSPGANGSAPAVEAFNAGDGSLNLSAAVSASWLTATVGAPRACSPPRSGNCIPVSIALNTSTLAAGTYTEFITLSDPNAVDAPADISVTVTVAGVPNAVTLYATPAGGTQPTVTAPVFVSSPVTGTATTQTGGKWLSFSTGSSSSVNFLLPYNIQAAAQIGQAPGVYTGAVAVSGSRTPSENKSVAVTLNVTCSPILAINNSTIRLNGIQGGPVQYAVVSFANLAQGTGTAAGCPSTPLAVTGATATSAGNFLAAGLAGTSGLLISTDPATLTPGTYTGTVTIASNAVNNSQVSIPIQLSVAPSGKPLISSGGIINIANYAPEAVSPGDIVAIFGSQLADAAGQNPGPPPLATQLGATQVLVNGVPAPLYYVSPAQVNFQMPYNASGTAVVQVVNNGSAGNSRSVAIAANVPRFLIWPDSIVTGGYAIAVNSDGSLPLPSASKVQGYTSHPARPGDSIVIYGVGFGQTSPAAVDGAPATSSAPLQTITGTTPVTFGGGFQGRPTSVSADFVGLTPTAVGLYQVNVKIPADTPLGTLVPVTAVVKGVNTAIAYIAISTTGR